MARISIEKTPEFAGQKVKISGWVHLRRDHGKLIFIDLRDASGVIQVVFIPKNEELRKLAETLRSEWVISIEGTVNQRPKGQENPDIKTGGVEMLAEKLEILNEAKTPPFEISEEKEAGEEIRMKYRYLDLRRQRMAKNIALRHNVIKFCRDFLCAENFLEIETPYLTKGTPEGAREFAVPSRLHKGKFYVLPQSPQQFKQLLMVAGFEKYFQVARCFRDEDTRGDRQPEFTQLDIEMSFISETDIMSLIEKILIDLVEQLNKNGADYKISRVPFPRISHAEAMEKYKSDKPDLRENKEDKNELAFCWIVDFPLFEYSETDKKLVSSHHPFTAPKDEDLPLLQSEPAKIKAKAYDIVLNGFEIGGGSIRIHKKDLQAEIFGALGVSEKEAAEKFGHMLEAFEYGAPPHGGIALGVDRLCAILAGEPTIREVIAFPKTGDGRDLMMDAPAEISKTQLKELGIKINE
ncbi:MAG: aspartate--tRNA ligase [Patescibacteria group bacterium]